MVQIPAAPSAISIWVATQSSSKKLTSRAYSLWFQVLYQPVLIISLTFIFKSIITSHQNPEEITSNPKSRMICFYQNLRWPKPQKRKVNCESQSSSSIILTTDASPTFWQITTLSCGFITPDAFPWSSATLRIDSLLALVDSACTRSMRSIPN